jgi:predicted type IV restriction endonuclease
VPVCEGLTEAIAAVLDSIDKAQGYGSKLTEAMTEAIVIDKLLQALGYEVWECQKQGFAEGIGTIPDYTLLPKTVRQWFLEVKKWKSLLTEKDASQAVTYAFNQGSRWAVLTNGDEWRIYDAHNTSCLADKCVLILPSISSPEAGNILSLLSKEAITNDRLATTLKANLIFNALRKEFSDVNSSTIKFLRRTIESEYAVSSVKKEEVKQALNDICNINYSSVDIAPQIFLKEKEEVQKKSEPVIDNTINYYSITELLENNPTPERLKPCKVCFPEGLTFDVKTWADAVCEIVKWVAEHHGLPRLPYFQSVMEHGKTYFLNTEPVHADGTHFRGIKEIMHETNRVFIDTSHSAYSFCRILSNMMNSVGADPSSVKVALIQK